MPRPTCHRLLVICLTLCFTQPAVRAEPTQRPNILWITVEDISPWLGAYGDQQADTPNIDQLAREGVRYTRAYTPSGVCSPSRAALITGMYPTAIGAHHMRTGANVLGRLEDANRPTGPPIVMRACQPTRWCCRPR